MIDLVEIYVHWYAGRSQVQIADSLGLDRKTVRKYLGPVVGSGLVPGGPPVMTEEDWRARAQSWFPALVDKGLRQVSWPDAVKVACPVRRAGQGNPPAERLAGRPGPTPTPTTPSATNATPKPSPPRPPWTGCTSSPPCATRRC